MTIRAAETQFTDEERLFLQSKTSLTMCVGPNFMPYEDIVEGKYIGIISEFMTIVSDNIDIPFALVATDDWEGTMQSAKSRRCDFIPFIISMPERKKFLNFTQPYIGEAFVIATLSDKPFVVDVQDIIKRRLAIVRGYAYVEILKFQYPGINIIEVDSIVDGLNNLNDGELYAYLDGLNIIGYNIQQLGLQNIKISGTLNNAWDVSMGSRNDMPIINDILNKGLDLITESDRKKLKIHG